MGGLQPFRQLSAQSDNFLPRQSAARQLCVQGDTCDVLRDQEVSVVVGIEIENSSDVWMIEFGQSQRFSAKPFPGRLVSECPRRAAPLVQHRAPDARRGRDKPHPFPQHRFAPKSDSD